MNNIFLNNDPLLYRSNSTLLQLQPNDINDVYNLVYRLQLMNEITLPIHDWVGNLDNQLKSLDLDVVQSLNLNDEYKQLNIKLLNLVLTELMNLVRSKLNTNQGIIDNVKRLLEIILKTANSIKETERQSMSELNDYMKNYSHLTFDEYKKIKQQKILVLNVKDENART